MLTCRPVDVYSCKGVPDLILAVELLLWKLRDQRATIMSRKSIKELVPDMSRARVCTVCGRGVG